MTYKSFMKKIIYLQAIILLVFIILLIYVEFNYPNKSLHSKKYLFNEKVKIYFAGDSRSQRGLNPIIASKYLNIKKHEVVNIAVDGGDPSMLVPYILGNMNKFKNSEIIISISANQMNDGANDLGRFTNSMISNLSFYEKIDFFYPNNINVLINFYKKGLKNLIPKFKNKFEKENGFQSVDKIYDFKTEKQINLSNHPWYKNWNSKGYKFKILEKSLKKIKNNVKQIYIFTAPYAPSYQDSFSYNDNIIEESFKNSMYYLANNLNIKYIYYDNKQKNFKNLDFSDNTHLNRFGAEKFTKKIIKDFFKR